MSKTKKKLSLQTLECSYWSGVQFGMDSIGVADVYVVAVVVHGETLDG